MLPLESVVCGGVYLDFVRRVTSEPRFLANIRHPEAGWKVSRSELRMFLGGEKATMQCFIRHAN